jgi:hypothetical protein
LEKEKEYERLAILEMETAKLRHTTFTALLSISFLLPGLALRGDSGSFVITGKSIPLSHSVFFLGYVFYLFAIFHYSWHHRYSHSYRKALKKLEEELGITVYRLRCRPQIGPFKFHYNWALYVIGIAYGLITARYIGLKLFLSGIGIIMGSYVIFFLLSYWQPVEPLEKS